MNIFEFLIFIKLNIYISKIKNKNDNYFSLVKIVLRNVTGPRVSAPSSAIHKITPFFWSLHDLISGIIADLHFFYISL